MYPKKRRPGAGAVKAVRLVLILMAFIATATRAAAANEECVVPARQGGGFDLTCRLVLALADETGGMRITYMPGGVGAVAYNMIVAQRRAESGTLVAFSGGSLLNLAQGKFGKFTGREVRWLATIGADYGMVAVRADAPFRNIGELLAAVRRTPRRLVFGGGGTIGSQDWIKAASLLRAANIGHRAFPYVSFEGGGEASTALLSGHVDVYTGDVSEVRNLWREGKIRILGILADARLEGEFADVPTAKEQGFPVTWRIVRGFYLGPDVPAEDYEHWVRRFDTLLASESFRRARHQSGLLPFDKTGREIDAYIDGALAEYRAMAERFGLIN